MPRAARSRSESGIYHAIVRGINKQDIFLHPHDKIQYLETLMKAKQSSECSIFAYCLMSNHVHLLLSEGEETIGEVMKRVGTAYVYWFNQQYERVGHLFQDRFMSEPVESDEYLLAALRYIHQNPVKAGLTSACEEFTWSSYLAYAVGKEHPPGLTDVSFVLDLVGGVKEFQAFHQAEGRYDFEYDDRGRASDATVLLILNKLLAGESLSTWLALDEREREPVIRQLRDVRGASERQIARLVGLPRHKVRKA